jgi:hypothetical protein
VFSENPNELYRRREVLMSEEVPSTQKAEALDENSSFTASSV